MVGFRVFGAARFDKLKGTNEAKFAVFRRFLQIFAFPRNCNISEAQIFAETAASRRFSQQPVCPIVFVPFNSALFLSTVLLWQVAVLLRRWLSGSAGPATGSTTASSSDGLTGQQSCAVALTTQTAIKFVTLALQFLLFFDFLAFFVFRFALGLRPRWPATE